MGMRHTIRIALPTIGIWRPSPPSRKKLKKGDILLLLLSQSTECEKEFDCVWIMAKRSDDETLGIKTYDALRGEGRREIHARYLTSEAAAAAAAIDLIQLMLLYTTEFESRADFFEPQHLRARLCAVLCFVVQHN